MIAPTSNNKVQELIEQAKNEIQSLKIDVAIDILKSALYENSFYPEVYSLLARAYHINGDTREAITHLSTARLFAETIADFATIEGDVLEKAFFNERPLFALDFCSEVLKIDPKYQKIIDREQEILDTLFDQAEEAVWQGDYEMGIAISSLILYQDSSFIEALEFRAFLFFEKGMYLQAFQDAVHLITLDPRRAHAYKIISQIYFSSSDFDKTLTVVGNALKYVPASLDLHVLKSECFFQKKEYNKALELINEIHINNKEYLFAYYKHAEFLLHLNDLKNLETLFEVAFMVVSKKQDAINSNLLDLSYALYLAKKGGNCIDFFLRKVNKNIHPVLFWIRLAQIYQLEKKEDKMNQAFERAKTFNSNHPLVRSLQCM